jgi:hypothetical protein
MMTESKKQKLVESFQAEKVLGLEMIKAILDTTSRMTVFRQLKVIGYYSSYSHTGKYYTLSSIPAFDINGLWSYGGIHFSENGNLMETIAVLVKSSEAGYFASELEQLLDVFVHNAVGKLFSQGRLQREQIGDQYLYMSPMLVQSQFLARKKILTQSCSDSLALTDSNEQVIVDHLKTFLSVLNEKQRRLYLGLESIKLGRGGDVRVASVAGADVKTIARGRQELLSKRIEIARIRRKGAGRPPLKKTKS